MKICHKGISGHVGVKRLKTGWRDIFTSYKEEFANICQVCQSAGKGNALSVESLERFDIAFLRNSIRHLQSKEESIRAEPPSLNPYASTCGLYGSVFNHHLPLYIQVPWGKTRLRMTDPPDDDDPRRECGNENIGVKGSLKRVDEMKGSL
ncbi:hypothetical protein CEXT_241281 [Caerostris extrusa]|uniref:Integrase zinc-binding domain-containing protein n=1 Tax=Caerostris extrusa TaxID=172846 RepID=A0AAV4WL72_CAEEX|nr:hypothetical protein CEXT_241281 [Caerostris extrusa]